MKNRLTSRSGHGWNYSSITSDLDVCLLMSRALIFSGWKLRALVPASMRRAHESGPRGTMAGKLRFERSWPFLISPGGGVWRSWRHRHPIHRKIKT
jgi:hypothetical protein